VIEIAFTVFLYYSNLLIRRIEKQDRRTAPIVPVLCLQVPVQRDHRYPVSRFSLAADKMVCRDLADERCQERHIGQSAGAAYWHDI
jgi:hypothetical protein